MRRDAQVRRDALIAAGAELFAARGYDVPLEEVAVQAGVGRGTLYRNFQDRSALALAIFDRELDHMAQGVDPAQDLHDTLRTLIRAGARGSALYARIGSQVAEDQANRAAFERLGDRFAGLLEPIATRARTSGALRPDVDGRKLAIVVHMIGGLARIKDEEKSALLIEEALDLVLTGLRSRA
ncbi:TetR/AcrR family transcriptional regulator [Sphingomonas aracearum]|uniref:TetR/AcrR family transcriptional regulator n=1 Tax=Sphingomonas aracearum TaxID=2283317 RepID=A0A369VY33_9SPHN|nr:TetR/AcrR family transcriptional regulator [Sphingomonas aracearum]RDE06040.1 TetR/AcrR family transcriptional regulator [Sphingomonas aracearum]